MNHWVDDVWPLPPSPRQLSQDASWDSSAWYQCSRCSQLSSRVAWIADHHVCSHCGHHSRWKAMQWFSHLSQGAPIRWIGEDLVTKDVIGFQDTMTYPERLAAAKKKSGESESLACASTTMNGKPVVMAVFDFSFMGGSLGSTAGRRFVMGVDYAIKYRHPFICVAASGGARMQEGVVSLLQMATTTQALSRLADARLPYISILTDPTTGGVAASLAMQADIIIAEPGALIGFTGPRVIEQTIKKRLPEGFQSAEFCCDHGFIDQVVARKNIPQFVTTCLKHLTIKSMVESAV